MTRRRSSSGAPPDAAAAGAPAATRGARPGLAWAALLALIGVGAWLRIFSTWFAQDDFRWLLRAAQGPPPPWATPRVLSMSLAFRALHALAGTRPWVYHAVSLALHVATGLIVYRVLARWLDRRVAALAAAFALTSPALFDALHWVSAIADLLCAFFLALAVWLLAGDRARGVRGWLAVAAYALALASKEIAAGALPALVVLQLRAGGRARVARAVACAALALLAARAAAGAWETGAGGSYAWKPAAVLLNLPAFVAAALLGGSAYREPSDLVWSRLAWVQVAGWALLALWLAALVARRSRGAWLGFVWFTGLLAPVAMLERQFQFYYLCCALPGLAASVAFLARGPAGSLRVAGWVAAALVVAQVAAVEARSAARLRLAPLPADFVLRRSLIARNAIGDLARAQATLGPRLVLLGQQPVEAAWQGRSTTEATDYTRDPWWDENVRGALSDGEAVRLMFPAVRDVVFKSWLEAEDSASTIAGYRIDGRLTVADYRTFVGLAPAPPSATLDERLARAGDLIRRRLFREALGELLAAGERAPDNPDVLVNLGALQAHLGDSTAALGTLARALEVAPGDLDARYNLGLLQWRLGRRDEARETWARLLAEAPRSDLARNVRELLAGEAR